MMNKNELQGAHYIVFDKGDRAAMRRRYVAEFDWRSNDERERLAG